MVNGENLAISAALSCNGIFSSLEEDTWELVDAQIVVHANGVEERRGVYIDDDFGLQAVVVRESYRNSPVSRHWLEVKNIGSEPVIIERLDSLRLWAPVQDWEVLSFTSGWGKEFEPETTTLSGKPLVLETRAGRSSQGRHPYATLTDGESRLTISVAWSGNWIIRFEPEEDEDGYFISAGLNDWEFLKELLPGQEMVSPAVVVALTSADLNSASIALAAWGRRCLYPSNVLSGTLPVEWNHWWPYEDWDINEEVFRRNADEAAALGLEVVVLDAGWFGRPGLHWSQLRGDWELVNHERFPGGIAALSDYVHDKGLRFGIWCEIEAAGKDAELNKTNPEYIARRDGQSLGYVCMGNPAVREWAYDILEHLIVDYNVDWIKLDFNLDPGAGCNRTDHGHGIGDGLFEHYRGYYSLLERVRRTYPEVVLENCSSGGLRIDLGMLAHTHMTFLSDPDWPVHDLQLFWGASCMLAPNACLHWAFGEWRANHDRVPQQVFDPRDPNLKQHALDYYVRISMLNWFGYSLKLPEAPQWVRERLAYHARTYQMRVRRFVRSADLFRLSEQPLRNGGGDRWQGFLYVMPDGQEGVLFVFRLPGSEDECNIQLDGLIGERVYTLEDDDSKQVWRATGEELMEEGITFNDLSEEGSALIYLA
ncbi:MAG: alpha-galactosidase [Anaerolineae bacterium]